MTARPLFPTPFDDVNAIVDRLLGDVRKVLDDRFLGMYFYGSLATGGFDPDRSDVDFIVVTEGHLPEAGVSALEAMHERLGGSGMRLSKRLEGSYISREEVRRYRASTAKHPTIGADWVFGVNHHGVDGVIQRHVIREHRSVITGPDPVMLIDPVSQNQLRGAALQTLHEFWEPMIQDPSWLEEKGSEYHAFAVLTMCRVLHLMEHGTIVSKPAAAAWARRSTALDWSTLIDRSLVWREGEGVDDLSRVLDLIRHTVDSTRSLDPAAL